MTKETTATKTAMEVRARAIAEQMVDFARPRMMTTQTAGLALILVSFAESELKRAIGSLSPFEFTGVLDNERCFFCAAERWTTGSGANEQDMTLHDDDCAWAAVHPEVRQVGRGDDEA